MSVKDDARFFFGKRIDLFNALVFLSVLFMFFGMILFRMDKPPGDETTRFAGIHHVEFGAYLLSVILGIAALVVSKWTAQRKKAKRLGIIFVVIVMCVFLLGFRLGGGLMVHRANEIRTDFPESRFLILLFPTDEKSFCERAVIVNLEEYEKDYIEIYHDEGVRDVAKEHFCLLPGAEKVPLYIKRLNEELVRWGDETDWKAIDITFTEGDLETRVVVKVEDKKGAVCKYYYFVGKAGTIRPINIKYQCDVAKKMAG